MEGYLQIGLRKSLWSSKLKIQYHVRILFSDLNNEKIVETFSNDKSKRIQNWKSDENKNWDCMSNGRAVITHSIAGLIWSTLRMNQQFPEPYKHSGGNVRFELDLSNYATKVDLKGATGIDTSTLISNQISFTYKTRLDNLEVDKLKNVPADLS